MRPDPIDQQPNDRETMSELRRLRADHPDAEIGAELIRLDEAIVVIRVSIALPNGGSAAGFGATASGGPAAIETAESRALHRALTLLGYGSIAEAQAIAREAVPPPAPKSTPAAPFVPEITREPVRQVEDPVSPPVAPPVPTAAAPAPAPRTPAPLDDEPSLADYSWTEFWKWARANDLPNKTVVEELIGQSITSLNPAQVRNLIRAKTGIE